MLSRVLALWFVGFGGAALAAALLVSCFFFPSLDGLTGAGPADAGPPDARQDAQVDAAGWCPSFATFCEDFESTQPGSTPANWTPLIQGDASVMVYAQQDGGADPPAYRGSRALHAHANGGSAEAYILGAIPVRSSGAVVVRTYIYAVSPSGPVASSTNLLSIESRDPNLNVGPSLDLQFNTNNTLDVATDNGLGPTTFTTSSTPLLMGRWVCMEWIAVLAPSGHYTLLLDTNLAMSGDAGTVADASVDDYNWIGVGLVGAPAGGQVLDLYYDDVVVATFDVGSDGGSAADQARIGCER